MLVAIIVTEVFSAQLGLHFMCPRLSPEQKVCYRATTIWEVRSLVVCSSLRPQLSQTFPQLMRILIQKSIQFFSVIFLFLWLSRSQPQWDVWNMEIGQLSCPSQQLWMLEWQGPLLDFLPYMASSLLQISNFSNSNHYQIKHLVSQSISIWILVSFTTELSPGIITMLLLLLLCLGYEMDHLGDFLRTKGVFGFSLFCEKKITSNFKMSFWFLSVP